jgi:hypothetical protein
MVVESARRLHGLAGHAVRQPYAGVDFIPQSSIYEFGNCLPFYLLFLWFATVSNALATDQVLQERELLYEQLHKITEKDLKGRLQVRNLLGLTSQ